MSSYWIQKRGTYYVIVERGSNKPVSRHRSKAQADKAFQLVQSSGKSAPRPRGPRSLAHRYLGL